jgi:hypothetical protein
MAAWTGGAAALFGRALSRRLPTMNPVAKPSVRITISASRSLLWILKKTKSISSLRWFRTMKSSM